MFHCHDLKSDPAHLWPQLAYGCPYSNITTVDKLKLTVIAVTQLLDLDVLVNGDEVKAKNTWVSIQWRKLILYIWTLLGAYKNK